MHVLPFDSECAACAARLRADLEAVGAHWPARRPDCRHGLAPSVHFGDPQRTRVFPRAGLQWLNWHADGDAAPRVLITGQSQCGARGSSRTPLVPSSPHRYPSKSTISSMRRATSPSFSPLSMAVVRNGS